GYTPYAPASLGTLLASAFRKDPGDFPPASPRSAAMSPRPCLARLPSSSGSKPCAAFPGCRCGAGALLTATSYPFLLLDVPAPVRSASLSGSVSGTDFDVAGSIWQATFSPTPSATYV